MPRVKVDPEKNRIYLKFQPMSADELSHEVFEVVRAVRKLSPGFTCLTELTETSDQTPREIRYLRLIMEFMALMGVSRVVRVGAPEINDQWNRMSREYGGYTAEWAPSRAEAEKSLDLVQEK
jgi:hypothetical protein